MCCSACCTAVAAVAVFRSVVFGSVVVLVPEIPWFVWAYGFAASSAVDLAGRYLWCPLLPQLPMLMVVASCFA